MKKLMIAAAVVCAAVVTQAATISWSVSSVKKAKNAAGEFGTGTSYSLGSAGTFSVYLIDSKTAFDELDIDDIYDTYNGKTASFSGNTSGSSKTLTTTKDDYAKGDTLYAATILSYKDGDTTWYIANKTGITIGADGDNAKILRLHNTVGGYTTTGDLYSFTGAGSDITEWTAVSVPEPFSGTLALLGMGAIALRRKMKKAKKA